MFTGVDAFPCDSVNPMVTFKNIENIQQNIDAVKNKDIKLLIQSILMQDPDKRLQISQIKSNVLFKDINFKTLINENVFCFDEIEYENDLKIKKANNKSESHLVNDKQDFKLDDA